MTLRRKELVSRIHEIVQETLGGRRQVDSVVATNSEQATHSVSAVLHAIQLQNFASASRAVLDFLYKKLGFGLWMVTRTEGDDWIVLDSEDHGYDVVPGTVFRWADSFCSEMVKGNGPRIAPDSKCVAAYAGAPIGLQVEIGAYIGVPLLKADGGLFGTLCAIDPARQPDAIVEDQELIELLAALLSRVLQADLQAGEANRRSERLEVEVQTDALTEVYNRRAWDQLVAKEEDRCRRYGHPASILVVDLDGLKNTNDTLGHAAGDDLIVRAAEALLKTARGVDIVARLGGDEFGLLAVECDRSGAEAILKRARDAFAKAGVQASIGIAVRDPAHGLIAAHALADRRMYEEKRSR